MYEKGCIVAGFEKLQQNAVFAVPGGPRKPPFPFLFSAAAAAENPQFYRGSKLFRELVREKASFPRIYAEKCEKRCFLTDSGGAISHFSRREPNIRVWDPFWGSQTGPKPLQGRRDRSAGLGPPLTSEGSRSPRTPHSESTPFRGCARGLAPSRGQAVPRAPGALGTPHIGPV